MGRCVHTHIPESHRCHHTSFFPQKKNQKAGEETCDGEIEYTCCCDCQMGAVPVILQLVGVHVS